MNNKYLIAGGLIVVVLAGAYFLIPSADQPSSTVTDTRQEIVDSTDPQTEQIPNAEKLRYLDYSAERAASVSDTQKVVLFFHASWCPTCKAANQAFLNNPDSIPSDVLVLKTDYDTSDELKKKYDVNYQHTFVQIDDQGNQIQQWNGGDIDELVKRVQ